MENAIIVQNPSFYVLYYFSFVSRGTLLPFELLPQVKTLPEQVRATEW